MPEAKSQIKSTDLQMWSDPGWDQIRAAVEAPLRSATFMQHPTAVAIKVLAGEVGELRQTLERFERRELERDFERLTSEWKRRHACR